jgi:predicted transcriptional regulator
MSNKKDNQHIDEEKNNLSTIQHRLLNIKKLMESSKLNSSNPLKNINQYADTECFVSSKDKDTKSQDTRTVLGKRLLNFYSVINKLNGQLVYIKSGAYGHTFKGIVLNDDDTEAMSFAVKVVAYPRRDGYGTMHNITRPENAEICMLKLLSYFVIKGQTPHIILPINIFDTSIKPFLTLQTDNPDDTVVPVDNKNYKEFIKHYSQDKYYEKVSVIISEWANRGDLGMFLKKNYKKCQLIHWQCFFFQILSVLAVIQSKYPNFRHNDFKANNILISKTEICNKKLLYKVNKKEYLLPAIGYCTYIWDFDFACIPGVVENSKVYQQWTNEMNITSKQNRYYDVHYFFCTLVYKGFLPELMTEPNVPKEVKDFINWIIPEKYRPNLQTCNEMIKKIYSDTKLSLEIKNELKKFAEKYLPKDYIYKEYVKKIMDDKDTSHILKSFFKNLPSEHRQKVNERCRLLVDDELYLPSNILDHDFFAVFREK